MDILRAVTFSPGGRPILQKDLETGVFYAKARDSFAIQPGDKHQVVVSGNRRYGGGKIVGESHDNWSVGASWLITGATPDNCLTNLSTFLAQLETMPDGRFLEWRPDGATYSSFFELRGTARWNPQYKWVVFAGAQAIQVEVSFPVAPLVRGLQMDICDPFDVDSISDYTADAGAKSNVSITGGAMTAVANLATENGLIHTARGYNYADVECQVKGTPGATITSYKLGRRLKRTDAANYLDVYVDDNGVNSRLRIDKVVAGVRTNLATTNLAARVSAGTPFWLRGRTDGNVVFAEHFITHPLAIGTATTATSYTLSTAEAAQFGEEITGKTGLSWTPQHASATVDDYVDWPYTYDTLGQVFFEERRLGGPIPGDAPALVAFNAYAGTFSIPWIALGWMPEPGPSNLCWNGDFEQDTDGWGVAAVLNINGAATSITRQTSGSIGFGAASGEVTCPATSGTGASFQIIRRFRRGSTYTAEAWVYSAAAVTSVSIKLGEPGGDVATSVGVALSAGWQKISVAWTPTAERNAQIFVGVVINAATATTFRVDGVQVFEGTTPLALESQPEGRGASPAFGMLQAEACDTGDLAGFAITPDFSSGARHGFNLTWSAIGAGANGVASWFIDPNLLTADDFTPGEVQVEVLARMTLAVSLTTATALLTYRPGDGLGSAGERFTAEFPSPTAVKNLLLSPAGNPRLHRLGTLTLPVGSKSLRGKLRLLINAAGAASSIVIDELILLPVRRRACGPTGKSATSYPSFVPGTVGTRQTKIITSSLAGFLADNERNPSAASGLGGALLEMPPGRVRVAVRASGIPDEISTNATAGDNVDPRRVHFCVVPRWQLARDA